MSIELEEALAADAGRALSLLEAVQNDEKKFGAGKA